MSRRSSRSGPVAADPDLLTDYEHTPDTRQLEILNFYSHHAASLMRFLIRLGATLPEAADAGQTDRVSSASSAPSAFTTYSRNAI